MSGKQGDRLVDAVEMARLLSWTLDGLYRAVRMNYLPHYHLGPKLLRFDPNEVKAALKPKGNTR